jgi:ADP-ribosylglycohydrolase
MLRHLLAAVHRYTCAMTDDARCLVVDDTSAINATIVGGLIGAAEGSSALPPSHLETIVRCRARGIPEIHPSNAQAMLPELLSKAPTRF